MAKSDSALVQAATQFDEELASYARLGELFLKTPLGTLKHLERANQTLGEIADCEQRLADAGKRLIEALTEARQKQEQLSKNVVEYAPTLQARNETLRELMSAMAALAADAQTINAQVTQAAGKQVPADVSAKVLELSERAEQVGARSRAAEFPELGEQAHSLHQRLKAIATKLQKAGT